MAQSITSNAIGKILILVRYVKGHCFVFSAFIDHIIREVDLASCFRFDPHVGVEAPRLIWRSTFSRCASRDKRYQFVGSTEGVVK